MSEESCPQGYVTDAEWVPGYSGYRIDRTGRLYSVKRGRWVELIGTINSVGYRMFNLTDDSGRSKLRSAHSLVAVTFLGPREKGQQVLHYDDDKLNNSVANLRYGSSKENHGDAIRNGRKPKGESHHNSKLTANDVRQVRAWLAEKKTERWIAGQLHVSRSAITMIKRGTNWSWL